MSVRGITGLLPTFLVVLGAVAGCGDGSAELIGEDPVEGIAPAAEGPPSPVPPGVQARVVRVIDGDTIEVDRALDGRATVRYIGIDTPETVAPGQPVRCFGREASDHNKALVENKTVYLEKDVSETDRFGRLLRYVYLEDGRMVNDLLVAEGYAQVSTFPPDVKYQDRFLASQRQAREANRGRWNACQAPAVVAPTTTVVPAAVAATAVPQVVLQPTTPAVAPATAVPTSPPAPPQPTNPPAPLAPTATSLPLATATAAPATNCHASYQGGTDRDRAGCVRAGLGDYDCWPGEGNGPNYVRGPVTILGADEFQLDTNDPDNIGCEVN